MSATRSRAVNNFVRQVAEDGRSRAPGRPVDPTADSLEVVAGEDGRKLRDKLLTEELERRRARRRRPAHVPAQRPHDQAGGDDEEVAAEYPSYLILDRATFTLRLFEDLKLAKAYTVAVGQEGLETPAGLYEIQAKEENPTWYVPESDWAGDPRRARSIPPGPDDPIKARWMAIFEGAGIHGTEEMASLGSAASYGCVRMSIPDVDELYDQVEVGTPIFIG